MDDIELDDQIEDDYIEDSSYQACYVFRSGIKRDSPLAQPNKRQKRSHDFSRHLPWPRLSSRIDSSVLADDRRSRFNDVLLQHNIQSFNNGPTEERSNDLLSFINDSATSRNNTRLPTALLLTGLDKSNSQVVLEIVSKELAISKSCIFVSLQSRQCPNLQITLKNLIKTAIVQHSDIGVYNEFLARHKKFHPLNFDLELLEMFIQGNKVGKVVVSLSDVEDVEVSTVNDLVNSLYLWRTQIPSVLLLGITSTRELFEHRLSRSCLKHLDARTFNFAPSADQASSLLRTLQTSGHDNDKQRVVPGPSMIKTLRDLNQGQGNNSQYLESILQYARMSHFVADPVSALACIDIESQDSDDIALLANIARGTASFKDFCENVIADSGRTAGADLKTLLNDDNVVLKEVKLRIEEGANAYSSVCKLIYAFSDLYQELSRLLPKLKQPRLEIELQLFQTMHDLTNCQAYDDLRDGILSLNHRQLKDILGACDPSVLQSLGLHNVVNRLMNQIDDGTSLSPQRNGTHDPPAKTMPAKSPRGKSAKTATSPAKSSKHEKVAIDPITEDLINTIDRKLQVSSLDISSLLLHEAYILSSRTIHLKQNFDVQPRTAIERALLKPGDYLTCDCCSNSQHTDIDDNDSDIENVTSTQNETVKPTMPAACLLFTLLQEAPTIINVRDLFDAFSSHLNKTSNNNGIPNGESEEDSNLKLRKTMTLFYRALAELKMIGLIKASAGTQVKKRTAGGRASKTVTQDVDFIAKTSWAGS